MEDFLREDENQILEMNETGSINSHTANDMTPESSKKSL